MARFKLPLIEEGTAHIGAQFSAHVTAMRAFVRKHELPAELLADFPAF